ncbi:hypothetical protein Amn_53870 [Aminobacter sp. Y103A]|nr:hypothetical protein Amn_53870 [Aminobacter sp. SS-2016]
MLLAMRAWDRGRALPSEMPGGAAEQPVARCAADLSAGVDTEFDDVRLVLRRWQAACIDGALPPYEELALGSVGRFADEMAVVRLQPATDSFILRAGPRFGAIAGLSVPAAVLSVLPFAFQRAISGAIELARLAARPQLALCRSIVDGMVSTVEVLALPLSCRWPGEYFLIFARPRKSQIDLARLLINSTDEGILALSALESAGGEARDYQVLSINNAAARLLGVSAEDMRFRLLSQANAACGLSRLLDECGVARAHGVPAPSLELEYQLGGEIVSLQVGVAETDGLLAVTLTDIREIRNRETLFRSLFDDNPVPMYVRQADGGAFLNVNTAALNLYGRGRGEFLALGIADLEPGVADLPVTGERFVRHRTAAGSELDVIEYARNIQVGTAPATLSTIVDITERKRAEDRISYLAHHDPLTGVGNRTIFSQEIEEAVGAAVAGHQPFALLLVDLDDFKAVNDTLGHAAGDSLLVETASRIRTLLRRSDLVARLGGDEFAILLRGALSRADVQALAKRIIQAISEPHAYEGHKLSIGASLGAAIAPADAREAGTLLKCADLALYRSKRDGKGAFHFFEPEMDAEMRDRRELELELRCADLNRELELHYQPIISVKTGALRGFEALVRWRNPRRGMVSPAEFIPLAEETGMIEAIGRWVLDEACRRAATWPDDLVIAVNASAVQFRQGQFAQTIGQAIARSGLDPSRLEIEITESVLLADTGANLAVLQQLKQIGVRIALDDFGTGYSSMSYLRRFPFSRLKIDRSFVRDIGSSRESMAIVRAIIGLGTNLGIDTTAEGVETGAQLELLRRERCGEIQGFLFSPPVDGAGAADIIASYRGNKVQVA